MQHKISELRGQSALFHDSPQTNVRFSRHGRGVGFTTELIDKEALLERMRRRNVSPLELAEGVGLSQSTISNYLSGFQVSISSKNLDAIANFLRCEPLDLVMVVQPEPIEDVLPLPKPPVIVSAADLPLPSYTKGDLYRIEEREGRGGKKNVGRYPGVFSFVDCFKGNNRTHFMFQNIRGKFMVTFTDIDINTKAVEIKSVGDKKRAA